MNPEYQMLYVLGAIAASTAFARVAAQSRTGPLDWVALGSLALLLAEVISLAAKHSL
jgi:hypothetical protein